MTREEAIAYFKRHIDLYCVEGICREAEEMAIKALEQEPCEDYISRQAVLNALYALCDTGETLKENPWRDNPHIDAVIETIEELPPVTSQSKHEDIAKAFQSGISFGFIDGLANKTQESEDKE